MIEAFPGFRLWLGGLCVMALSLVACGGEPEPKPSDAGGAATYRGGAVSLQEAEQALRREAVETPRPDDGLANTNVDELLGRYRRAAENVALERIVTAGLSRAEVLAELGEKGAEIERHVVVNLYLGARLGELSVSPQEVEKFFEQHRAEFSRRAERNVWHLFRRHREGSRPEDTIELLKGLKRRAEAGEGFGQLAQEFSDSETRILGGRLGNIPAGRLPKKLEGIVFAIPAGGISAPIVVPGGAALFYVSEAIEARDFTLDEVKSLIVARLREDRRRARIAELVADLKPPEGSTVLESDRLMQVLTGENPETVALAVGDFKMTAKGLRQRFVDDDSKRPIKLLERPPIERFKNLYQDLLHEQLVLLAASQSEPGAAFKKVRDERIEEQARRALAERRIEARMRAKIAGDESGLRRFFEDNDHLFQSELRLRLRTLTVPIGKQAPQLMAQLEAARAELVSGKIDLEAAADRVNGDIADLGWVDLEAFMRFEPKVRFYVLDLNGKGYTVPFQANRRLSLIWVEDREEPKVLPFEEVRSKVEAVFFERTGQSLYQDVIQELLTAEKFRFEEANVRAHLAPGEPAPAVKTGA